jgi:nucleoside-diphosphate-sugar epimerase
MKILVSGATGFIGKYLLAQLEKDRHNLWILVRPNSDTEFLAESQIKHYTLDGDIAQLTKFMEKEKFDGVIHLASLFLAQHQPQDVQGLIESNVLFGTTLLDAAVQAKVPWFINTGTFWQHYDDQDYSPVNLYAATKQAFEDIAKYYLTVSPINFVTLQLSDTFGPKDTRPKVFNLWLKIAESGETLDMSPGEQLIDISYIGNVIDGYAQLIKLFHDGRGAELRGQVFALSSGQPLKLKDLAKIFEQTTGRKLRINWGAKDYRPREIMVPWNRGKSIPGWNPTVSLQEGIRQTFNEQAPN